jgi:hypothetical protein
MNSMYNDDELKYFHDKEEKYFFPENEEIYLGYECEVFQLRSKDEDGEYRNKWYPHIVELESDDYSYLYSTIMLSSEYRPLRTPYLTKEQLEAEGWEFYAENNSDSTSWYFTKGKEEMIYDFVNHKVSFNSREMMCKDINTFRKICKLLEIQ